MSATVLSIEKYLKTGASVPTKPEKEAKEKRRAELCESLGLEIQRELSDSIDPAQYYPEISGSERRIWMSHLPSRYSQRSGEWKGYRFDVVPTEVLEEVETAKTLRVFSDFEIWTPEQRMVDPIAVGVVGAGEGSRGGNAQFFLIARWGESLRPFPDIQREVLWNGVVTHGKSFPDIVREALCGYKMKERNCALAHFLGKKYLFPRHCGEGMYHFLFHSGNKDLFVCGRCGHCER